MKTTEDIKVAQYWNNVAKDFDAMLSRVAFRIGDSEVPLRGVAFVVQIDNDAAAD